MSWQEPLGRRFARLATDVVVRRPVLWRVFRGLVTRQFDRLAPDWDAVVSPEHLAPLEAALAAIAGEPKQALDVGTGTGAAALAVARRYPGCEVVGVDLSPRMVEEARARIPAELGGRMLFEVGDAAALPFESASFDLVTLANMIPFFDELARLVRPGGSVACSFSSGSQTPIYVAPERLRRELGLRGFSEFAEFAAGRGASLLATRGASSYVSAHRPSATR